MGSNENKLVWFDVSFRIDSGTLFVTVLDDEEATPEQVLETAIADVKQQLRSAKLEGCRKNIGLGTISE